MLKLVEHQALYRNFEEYRNRKNEKKVIYDPVQAELCASR